MRDLIAPDPVEFPRDPVGWDSIKDLFKRNLKSRFAEPKLKTLKRLAIDEISIGHGHRYLTIVLDLQSGAVVFIGKGKGADAWIPFWKRLKASHAKIEAVATDMSPAYIMAIRDNLPKALHVFDHFHVVKLFNDRLSDFRRELFREAEGPLGKKVLKGTRWLIVKNSENLDETKGERARLEEALRINQPLVTAYYMKEEFRHFWDQENVEAATRFLDDWCLRAEASTLSVLKKMASTLKQHISNVLRRWKYLPCMKPYAGVRRDCWWQICSLRRSFDCGEEIPPLGRNPSCLNRWHPISKRRPKNSLRGFARDPPMSSSTWLDNS